MESKARFFFWAQLRKPQMCTMFILSLVRAGAITKALALYDIMKRLGISSFPSGVEETHGFQGKKIAT